MLSRKYQSAIESSTAFMVKIEDLVREIAIQNGIPYYRIESHMEHHPHMGIEDTYMPVIRIITYFEDTVNQITEILRNEFEITNGKSIDKKKNRLDTFSYNHIQYFANLRSNRQELIEYKRSGNKKFELQLCSMLQDAWSGIEKELGYDNASDESKRNFYRVGALLEMVDLEFLKMRNDSGKKYEQKPTTIEEWDAIEEEAAVQVQQETEIKEHTNTFEEYLQEVAKEMQAPVAEAPPENITPSFSFDEQAREEIINNIAGQPFGAEQPETEEQLPIAAIIEEEQPEPVQEVEEQPIIAANIVEEQPLPEEKEVVQPVASTEPKNSAFSTLAKAFNQLLVPKSVKQEMEAPKGIVPQRFKPEVEAPKGIFPKRVSAPAIEKVANRTEKAEMKVDSNGSLAVTANAVENKNVVTDRFVSEVKNVSSNAEQPAPVQKEQPKPVVVNVVNQPIGFPAHTPAPETIPPVTDNIAIIQPEVVARKIENVQNINTNGSVAKIQEVVPEPEKMIHFEEQPKANKVVLDENAPITDASLREYVINSKLLKEVDLRIAERAGAKINQEIDIEGDVERLRFLKVFTLKQLQDRITDNKNDIVAFAEKWIGKDNGGSFDTGISLFYLEYLLVGKKNDPAFAIEYVVKFISDNDYSARYIIPTYNSIRSSDVSNNFSHLTLKA